MTMPKKDNSSIWSRVRADVDVDDLIFNREGSYSHEEQTCSDR